MTSRPEPFDKLSTGSVEGRAAAVYGAVDIGASGGRVMAGVVRDGGISLEPLHRFANGAEERDGYLRWDLSGLYEEVLVGLTALARAHPEVVSVGIDTWAVDYGLLDEAGKLIAEPVSYRDDRTEGAADAVNELVDADRLYEINGLQSLPFTTIYQLTVERAGSAWARARSALLLPDLLGYWLTGERRTEVTNASTTGLLDATTRRWSDELANRLDLPVDLFPPLIQPGEVLGTITADVAQRTGLRPDVTVVAVGSHDTASAVVGVPAADRDFAYVSSGTWSLVGVEVDEPVLTPASREANFTNEGGVDRRIRYLRNVGGLWLLQESLRHWRDAGEPADLDELLAQAAQLPSGGPLLDVDATDLIAPGNMPDRIRAACAARDQTPPETPAEVVRCVLDSLGTAYAATVQQAEELSGMNAEVIHIVGGGSQNALLCQLTADLAGRRVLSGPVEATAIGNVLVQARAYGSVTGDLEALRTTLRSHLDLREYIPQPASVPVAAGQASS